MRLCLNVFPNIPMRRKTNSTTATWWSPATQREVKVKHKAWKIYSESKQSEDYKANTFERNKTLQILRLARQTCEYGLVRKVKAEGPRGCPGISASNRK